MNGEDGERARAGNGPDRKGAVSAVVCNYDGEAYLEGCLDSILAQEGIDEVLVVDDASRDGSVALVRERFPQVEVVQLARNRGPGAARNAGMRAARNRWILAVDNDAILEPGVLPRLRAALEERTDAVAAQPRSVVHDEPGRVHYDGGAFHYVGLLSLRNFYTPIEQAQGEGVVPSDALIGICVLLDRDAVLSCGGYDEDFFYLAEDFDLAVRLRLRRHAILSVEDAIVKHLGGTAGLSFRGGGYPRRRAFLHSRNRWMLVGKAWSARTLIVALPGLLVYELAWTVFATASGHLGAHLAGKLAFLRGLRSTLSKRRAVQRGRLLPDRELLVGGPLTFSPSLVASPTANRAALLLDRMLRAWWWLVRPLAG